MIDDSFRATLYPGGILNTGFAVTWTQERMDESKPFGQAWTKKRADDGDTVCAFNQLLRLQNPDLVKEIDDNPYYSPDLGDSLAPITFVDKIEVPVFIAGAWQDEQTGGHFPAMLARFTRSPHLYVTLMNGLHTESLSPPVLGRYFEFLQLYVAKKVPNLAPLASIAPALGSTIWGVDKFAPFESRFAGMTYDAGAAPRSNPNPRYASCSSRVAMPSTSPAHRNRTSSPSSPVGRFRRRSRRPGCWAVVEASPARRASPMKVATSPTRLPCRRRSTPAAGAATSGRRARQYDWEPMPDGTGVGFVTAPLTDDTVIVGPGSVNLWIKSTSPDTDLEATISEVRPDGQEIYVQSGWLRASQRALADNATDLRPAHSNLEADAADLPTGEFTPVRVELFPFAHPFRAGSRLRLTIDAPGNSRAVWEFKTIDNGETVTIAHDAEHPSNLVLPVIPGIDVPKAAPPACGSLRGQPCRTWIKAANGG